MPWTRDEMAARARAVEAKKDIKLSFFIPQEGSLIWFDNLYIPKDAPHAANAHRFIEFLLDPGFEVVTEAVAGFVEDAAQTVPSATGKAVAEFPVGNGTTQSFDQRSRAGADGYAGAGFDNCR